ncbi:hypothetical protein ACFLUY_00675 [Chloroflexota bacterium]
MMLRGKLRIRLVGAIVCVTALLVMSPSVLATEPHEDPEIAKPVFSGISLLRYYSDALDFVLRKNPAEVETRLENMPFANIPQSLEESADTFAASGISISYLVIEIDEDLSKLRTLLKQSRLEETIEITLKILSRLSEANDQLERIELATETTGNELKVFSVQEQSDLRHSYDEVLEKINRIREMLDLHDDLLVDLAPMSEKIEDLLKLVDFNLVEILESTELILVEKPKPINITLEELLGSTEYALIKTLKPKDTNLGELLKLADISLAEFLQSTDITVLQELTPTDIALAELLKSADISLIKTLSSTDIAAEGLLKPEDFIIVERQDSQDIDLIELMKLIDVLLIQTLKPMDITMEVPPTVAFVGDNIRFEGVLISEGKPLAGREVDILVNSSRYVTVETDAWGHYQGILQVPYQYIPELDLQALYYPQDKDIGLFLASLSPVIKLKVLFYETELEITLEDRAYPGLDTMVTGRFDYGSSPPLNERKAEIYFDDILIAEFVAQEAFAQEIKIDSEADVGKHVITVSSAALGRYTSVVASATLNVTRATPFLDLNIPNVAMIPGSIGLEGKLYSEVGPLSEASIEIGLGKSQVELVSSKDGTFDTKIKVGMDFGVIGLQDLVIQVLPQEPWHAPLTTTSSVLVVNVVNSGAFVAILLFLGIYLPGRLKRKLGAYTRRKVRPETPTAPPELAPVYSERVTALSVTEESKEITGEPRDRVFYWYRLVARLLQGITNVLLGPQQTLREFAKETSRVLGPAAKYLIELTKMVERLLYSQYRPIEKDVDNSKQLSHRIEEETKLRVTTQPPLPGDLNREVTGAQLDLKEVSVASGARTFDFGGRVSAASPWRRPSTWLWVLLILAVAYYACILLFLLPLLLVSLALCLPVLIVDDSMETGSKAITKEESKSEGV